jgi:Mor family transcriptional regulator
MVKQPTAPASQNPATILRAVEVLGRGTVPHAPASTFPELVEVMPTDDVVEYTLRCVLAMAPQLTAAIQESIRQGVNKQVRAMFGGERAYISRRPGEGRFARNAQIRRDYKAGERIPLLQRRYGLSESRLWQIICE